METLTELQTVLINDLIIQGWRRATWADISSRRERLARLWRRGDPRSTHRAARERNGDPLLRAEGVWKLFGKNADKVIGTPDADLSRARAAREDRQVVAVRDISIEVWPGEVFVVMGLSGSGKSTLVRTLIRLIEPTAGKVTIMRPGRDGAPTPASCASCAATGSRWSSSTSACSRTAP